ALARLVLPAAGPARLVSVGRPPGRGLLGAVLLLGGFGMGRGLVPPMSLAYQDVPLAGVPHATMNTRIAQQVGASFGTAIVAVALQSLLGHGATSAFQGAFWWAIGITIAPLLPAFPLPPGRTARANRHVANAA